MTKRIALHAIILKGMSWQLVFGSTNHRIARELARIESKYNNPMSEDAIFELLKDFKYIVP